MSEIVKKKRGGQPGNQNARTHGFFSRIRPAVPESEYRKAADIGSINDEIALLRVKLKQAIEKDPENVAVVVRAVNALSRAIRLRNRISAGSFEHK